MWCEAQREVQQQYANCVMMGVEAAATTTTTAGGMGGMPVGGMNHSNSGNSTAAITVKRKLDYQQHIDAQVDEGVGDVPPAKTGRWDADDCIARLQAVAVPAAADMWRSTGAGTTTTTVTTVTTTSLRLDPDFDEEDEEFEDDLSDTDEQTGLMPPEQAKYPGNNPHLVYGNNGRWQQHSNNTDYWQYYPQPPQQLPQQVHHQHPQQHPPPPPHHPQQAPIMLHQQQHHLHLQQQQQQTIRCEENGKSYLELGAAVPLPCPPVPMAAPPSFSMAVGRCCDGRTRWCHVPCYRQTRMAVLNLSMCKLARYRQCSDPSLRRSVLICNTLRRLEREMEAEPPPPPMLPPQLPLLPPQPQQPVPVPMPTSVHSVEHTHPHNPTSNTSTTSSATLREVSASSSSGRATPFPHLPLHDADSGYGGDTDAMIDVDSASVDTSRPINWSSVLSLATQTTADLDALNNNDDLYAELGLSSSSSSGSGSSSYVTNYHHHHEWKSEQRDSDWDGFVHVLVGGS